jgi:hypothetical protein
MVRAGLPVGAERELARTLDSREPGPLSSWCDRWEGRGPDLGSPDLLAVVAAPPASPGLQPEESSGYIRVNAAARPNPRTAAPPASCC